MKTALLILASLLGASFVPGAQAQIPLPKLEARVTDLTGTLTASQQSMLEEKLAAFEARKGAQIAVLILPTTGPEDIAEFGPRLLESWKLGRKGVDDGALLIVAKQDRAARIEVQYGLEGVLTDATCGRIINDIVIPLFREGDFAGGIDAGVDRMLSVVDGEPLPAPDRRWSGARSRGIGNVDPDTGMYLLVAMAVLGRFLRGILGRGVAAVGSGVVGGAIAGFVFHSLLFGFLGGVIVIAMLLGTDSGSSRWYSGGGWSGGGFGGGGSGGGGGFSGGGGRGGGGGATGRW